MASKNWKIIKTTVVNDSKIYIIPLILFFFARKKINIEVEITKKTEKRYKEIIFKSSKDGADYILYVVKKKEDIKRFAEYLLRSNKLMFIDINSLIHNIKQLEKLIQFFKNSCFYMMKFELKILTQTMT